MYWYFYVMQDVNLESWRVFVMLLVPGCKSFVFAMGLLPDTQNSGCACAGNAGNVLPVTAGKRSRDARAVMHVGIAN